jgi:hypothetical protein
MYFGDFTRHETLAADRRGQFLSEGPHPHSLWVIPFEVAPWESGTHAAPVCLFVVEAGRYTLDYSEFKWARREVNRRARDAKARKAAAAAAPVMAAAAPERDLVAEYRAQVGVRAAELRKAMA